MPYLIILPCHIIKYHTSKVADPQNDRFELVDLLLETFFLNLNPAKEQLWTCEVYTQHELVEFYTFHLTSKTIKRSMISYTNYTNEYPQNT